jgi:hypothetical protein
MRSCLLMTVAVAISMTWLVETPARGFVPLASVGSTIAKSITRFFGKEGAQEGAEYLAKGGTREMMERVATTASREGGDAAVDRVAKLAAEHGPEALTALDNAPTLMPLVKALEELPTGDVQKSLVRLAAGKSGRELAEATATYGGAALRSELKHPGVGLVLVRSLGDDGAELANRLTSDQAIAVARHADELAALPGAQRQGVLSLLYNDTARVVGFLGRFAEANPGKTLFTAATTTVILAEPERILGGDEIVYDANGNPIVVTKSGFLGRTIDVTGGVAEHVSERYVRPMFLAVAAFLGLFFAMYAILKLWHVHRREQLKTSQLLSDDKPIIDAHTTKR